MRLLLISLIGCCLLHAVFTAPSAKGVDANIESPHYNIDLSASVSYPSEINKTDRLRPNSEENVPKDVQQHQHHQSVIYEHEAPPTPTQQLIVTEQRFRERQRIRKRLPHHRALHAQRVKVINYEQNAMPTILSEPQQVYLTQQQQPKQTHSIQSGVNVDVNVGHVMPVSKTRHKLLADANVYPSPPNDIHPVIPQGIIERSLSIPIGILQSLRETLGGLKLPVSSH